MGRHKRLYTGHWTQQALLSFPCIYRPCPPSPFDSALFAVMEPGSLAVGDRVSFGFLYFSSLLSFGAGWGRLERER